MGAARMGVIDFILALMQDMILSAIPALGFAMVFNVPIGRSHGAHYSAHSVTAHEW